MNQKIIAQKTALVVIGFVKWYFKQDLKPNSKEIVVSNTVKLVEKFNEIEAFTVLVRVTFTDGKDSFETSVRCSKPMGGYSEGWDEYIPKLKNKKYFSITKRQWGAFWNRTRLTTEKKRNRYYYFMWNIFWNRVEYYSKRGFFNLDIISILQRMQLLQ